MHKPVISVIVTQREEAYDEKFTAKQHDAHETFPNFLGPLTK